jgi:hypothetical protein
MIAAVPRKLLVLLVSVVMALFAGCGGSYNAAPKTNVTPSSGTQNVVVGVTDGPGDRILAFTVTINSIDLVSSTGAKVSVVSTPTTVEVSHLAGTTFPLGRATIPQGTYSQATISISNPSITFVDPATGQTVKKNLPISAITATVNIQPPLVVGSTAMAVNFDLNLFGSVNIDASGNVTFSPQFREEHHEVPDNDQDPFDGELEHAVGTVQSVSGSSFTALFAGTQKLTFATNSSTQFEGVSGISGLSAGMLVVVEAKTQSDGTLLAKEVKAVMANAANAQELDGVITTVTGAPATQLQLVVQDEEGPMMTSANVGTTSTVAVTSSTAFRIDNGDVDLHNLPFTPTFTSSTVHAGQRVEVHSGGGSGGTLSAGEVDLEHQALHGTVSAVSGNSFTLTVASDSSLATIAKVVTVTVFKQASTQVDGVTVANGATVVVRGLLFVDSGAFKLVADHIGD